MAEAREKALNARYDEEAEPLTEQELWDAEQQRRAGSSAASDHVCTSDLADVVRDIPSGDSTCSSPSSTRLPQTPSPGGPSRTTPPSNRSAT